MTKNMILGALALAAAAGATLATVESADARSYRGPGFSSLTPRPFPFPHRPHRPHRPHWGFGGGIVIGAAIAPSIYEVDAAPVRVCRRVVVGGYTSHPRIVTRCRLVAAY